MSLTFRHGSYRGISCRLVPVRNAIGDLQALWLIILQNTRRIAEILNRNRHSPQEAKPLFLGQSPGTEIAGEIFRYRGPTDRRL